MGWRASITRVLMVLALAVLGLALPAPAAFADVAPVTSVIPDAYLGVPYSYQLEAAGGTEPYHWQFVGGLGCTPFPPGLEISDSGLVSGTPTFAVGHCTMNMAVVDGTAGHSYHPVTVTITVQAVPPPCTAASFAAVFNDAADGSVVTVCDDLDVSGHALTVPAGRDITLDLDGHTLTANGVGGAPALTIPAGTSVTEIDSAVSAGGAAGNATFDGIVDDGALNLSAGAQVTSNGAITGSGAVSGPGSTARPATLENNGAIRATIAVTGVAVAGHDYLLRIYQNDGTPTLLADVYLYAPTLGAAGISIDRDWSARDRPGYALSGWYLNADGTGAPLTDSTDFSQGETVMAEAGRVIVNVYAGWSTVAYADSEHGDDGNGCTAAAPCRTIAAALAKAGAGGTVVVAAGSYGSEHGGADLAITKSVSIQGASAGSVTVQQGDGTTAPAIAVSGGAHVAISGMTVVGGRGPAAPEAVVYVSGDGSTLALTDTDVTDADPDSGSLYGVSVEAGAHADISGGTIHDLPFGVGVSGGGTLAVSGSTVRDNGNSGVVFAADAGPGSTIDSATISGNGVTTEHGAPAAVGNTAGVLVHGGGVGVTDSTLRGNSVGLEVFPGAHGDPATVKVVGGNIDANLAGGVAALFGGTATITGTVITGNNAGAGTASAAGVSAAVGAMVTVNDAVISGNGIGVSNLGGTVTVERSSITGNLDPVDPTPTAGGGIQTLAAPSPSGILAATTAVSDSTIADNQAGILATSGITTVTDSTVAGNDYFGAVADSHGIVPTAPSDPVRLSLVRSTVAHNGNWPATVLFDTVPLAGVGAGDDGTVTLAASLVTKGTLAPACAVGGGAVVDAGYTLVDDGSCPLTDAGSVAGADPQLGALADNGSTATPITPTMLPAAGSPALARIPVGAVATVFDETVDLCAAGSTDQRGVARPAPSGAKCDIGAAERDESADPGATGGGTGGTGTGGAGGSGDPGASASPTDPAGGSGDGDQPVDAVPTATPSDPDPAADPSSSAANDVPGGSGADGAGELPATGFDSAAATTTALVLLLAGVALLIIADRGRRPRPRAAESCEKLGR